MLAQVQFDIMTNRETWLGRIEIRDLQGQPIDLSQAELKLEVSSRPYGNCILFADHSNEKITGTEDGIIEWEFSESDMRKLHAGYYKVGIVYILDGRSTQVILGDLHIEDGAMT